MTDLERAVATALALKNMEIERLRAALQEIAAFPAMSVEPGLLMAKKIARDALNGKERTA